MWEGVVSFTVVFCVESWPQTHFKSNLKPMERVWLPIVFYFYWTKSEKMKADVFCVFSVIVFFKFCFWGVLIPPPYSHGLAYLLTGCLCSDSAEHEGNRQSADAMRSLGALTVDRRPRRPWLTAAAETRTNQVRGNWRPRRTKSPVRRPHRLY